MLALFHNLPTSMLDRLRPLRNQVTEQLIQPHWAVPGSPGKILAYTSPPGWACDYALVNDATTDAGLIAALKHVLDIEAHPNGVSMSTWLSRTLGVRVEETTQEWSRVE